MIFTPDAWDMLQFISGQRLVTQWARSLWAGTISCQRLVTQWARACYGQELFLVKGYGDG